MADRIAMAHARDRYPDVLFATAGNGAIDFTHFIARRRKAGFDGQDKA